MRLSVFYDHVTEGAKQSNMDLDKALAFVKSCNIDALECNYFSLCDNKEETRKKFGEAGLNVSGIYRMFDLGNIEDETGLNELLELAKFYNSESVLVIPGFVSVSDAYEATRKVNTAQMIKMSQSISTFIKKANAVGIDVIMEDFDDAAAPFASEVQLKWFADNTPGLNICFDTGNFYYAEVDEIKAFELLKDKITHVHLKDRALLPDDRSVSEEPKLTVFGKKLFSTPVGGGVIRIEEIIRRLKSAGYEGTLAIEHFGACDQLGYIEKSAQFVLEKWND